MERSWNRRLMWLGAGVLTALVLYLPVRGARRAAQESAQRSLIVQVEQQLAAYNAVHGRYPDSLKGMQFTFSDGADAATLERIEYHTDGTYYRIVTASDFDGDEISVCK
jgi:type II secretory pathway pseudopilin PulG